VGAILCAMTGNDSSLLNELAEESTQRWPRPSSPLPIVVIGAGGIVNASHLPAYRACGLVVAGVFDIDRGRAKKTAEQWAVPRVFESLEEAAGSIDARSGPKDKVNFHGLPRGVFDIAIPAASIAEVLSRLPRGCAALIQKPMGVDLEQASRILELCRERAITAAINFQMRFSPALMALRRLLEKGRLGRITDVEVRVNTYTPWQLWDFLKGIPRMEILYHSIHYLDVLRSLLAPAFGEPRAVHARTTSHPDYKDLASVASTMILDFGDELHCTVITNHCHRYGLEHAASHLRVEGNRGAAVARLGVNLDYPRGLPDSLELNFGLGWRDVPLAGNWFPDAFRGPMCNLQRFLAREDDHLVTSADDAWKTMALVEACYLSNSTRGTPIQSS